MNGRRALQIGLMLVMALFLVEMFTPLHEATCSAAVTKKSTKGAIVPGKGAALSDEAPVAFQIHGGDNAFGDALRAKWKDAMHAAFPDVKLLDGPPGRNGVLVVFTLKSNDSRWTPFYSHEGLGATALVQLPGIQKGEQHATEADIDAVCKGLVARAHFSEHDETTSAIATWLVDELKATRSTMGATP